MSKLSDGNKDRKQDHIALTFEAQLSSEDLDHRFYYEPLLQGHPNVSDRPWGDIQLAGKSLQIPLWVSSMTGGTTHAKKINTALAKVSATMGMGLGLGSCRILLESDKAYDDFDVRCHIGNSLPLFANMGIAQLEKAIFDKKWDHIEKMMSKLDVDGLIVHINPIQEWFQPEGDHFLCPPIETIQKVLERCSKPIIVKEVGQGMGPESLTSLLKLPIEALEFGAAGGTNFALLEGLRSNEESKKAFLPLTKIGHSAIEMVNMVNTIIEELGENRQCNMAIISGGIHNFLDGYFCIKKINMPAIYGQASAFLKRAMINEKEVERYVQYQKEGLQLAYHYLRLK